MWGKTVINRKELGAKLSLPSVTFEEIAKAQAEATWDIAYKAGRDSMIDEMVESINTAQRLSTKAGKKAGIHEVVEWVEKQTLMLLRFNGDGSPYTEVPLGETIEWQAQKKEWGIKEEK